MSWFGYLIGAILIFFSLLIIVVVLLQQGRQANLGAISGAADSFFDKGRARTVDAMLGRWTKFIAIGFFVLCLVGMLLTRYNGFLPTRSTAVTLSAANPTITIADEKLASAKLSADGKTMTVTAKGSSVGSTDLTLTYPDKSTEKYSVAVSTSNCIVSPKAEDDGGISISTDNPAVEVSVAG